MKNAKAKNGGGPMTAERMLSPAKDASPFFGPEDVTFHGVHTQPRRDDWHPAARAALFHVFEFRSRAHPDRFRVVMMHAGINRETRSPEEALRGTPLAAVGGNRRVQMAWTREDHRRGGLFRALLRYAEALDHPLDPETPLSEDAAAALRAIRGDVSPERTLPLRFEMLHLDTIGGGGRAEHKWRLLARLPDGTVVGGLDFTEFDGHHHIDFVMVHADWRRRGIGLRLLQELTKLAPWPAIRRGGFATPEGQRLLDAMDRRPVPPGSTGGRVLAGRAVEQAIVDDDGEVTVFLRHPDDDPGDEEDSFAYAHAIVGAPTTISRWLWEGVEGPVVDDVYEWLADMVLQTGDRQIAYITGVEVEAGHRRQQHGTRLMTVLQDYLHKQGVERVWLIAVANPGYQEKLTDWYRRLGYETALADPRGTVMTRRLPGGPGGPGTTGGWSTDPADRLPAAVAYIQDIVGPPGPDLPARAAEHSTELFALFQAMRETAGIPFAVSAFTQGIPIQFEVETATALAKLDAADADDLDEMDEAFSRYLGEIESGMAEELVGDVLDWMGLDPDDSDNRDEIYGDVADHLSGALPSLNIENGVSQVLEAASQAIQRVAAHGAQNLTAMASHEVPHLDVMQERYEQNLLDAASGGDPERRRQLLRILRNPDEYSAEEWHEQADSAYYATLDGVVVDLSKLMLVSAPGLRTFYMDVTDRGVVVGLHPGFALVYQETMSGYDPALVDDRKAFWEFDADDVFRCARVARELFGGPDPRDLFRESVDFDHSVDARAIDREALANIVKAKDHLKWFGGSLEPDELRGLVARASSYREPLGLRTADEAEREGSVVIPPRLQSQMFEPRLAHMDEIRGRGTKAEGFPIVRATANGYTLVAGHLSNFDRQVVYVVSAPDAAPGPLLLMPRPRR